MKYKKYGYLVILVIMLLVGINRTYAATAEEKSCYYMSDDGSFKARATIKWNYEYSHWTWILPPWGAYNEAKEIPIFFTTVDVDKIDGIEEYDDEYIANWFPGLGSSECIKDKSVCFGYRYKSNDEANTSGEPPCPKYFVFQDTSQYWVFATDDFSKAKEAQERIRALGYRGYYGKQTTANNYFAEYIEEGLITQDKNGNLTCNELYSNELFGDKNNPDSISYMINQALQYVRIIVPILIILLGTIDFAKAVIAGKEDNMKKAQSTFVKRLVAGVAVFFIPLLVNIIMDLADMVWAGEYFTCPL